MSVDPGSDPGPCQAEARKQQQKERGPNPRSFFSALSALSTLSAFSACLGSACLGPRSRWRRWGLWGVGASLGVLLTALLLDALFPPDYRRYHGVSLEMVDESGALLRPFTTPEGLWRLRTRPDAVDPLYLRLLLAYEDKRFHHHPGIDPLALGRAVGQLFYHGRIVSGASTLTMQVARLLEPRPRTLPAKLIEMARALQLEARLDKDQILAIYLTLAPFGGNLEGVRAASLAYFDHDPRRLSVAEAALLVALPQSPTARRPDRHPERARAARAQVLERAVAAGVLTRAQARKAAQEPIPGPRHPLPFLAPHLGARLLAQAQAQTDTETTTDPTTETKSEAETVAPDEGAKSVSAEASFDRRPPLLATTLRRPLQRQLETLTRRWLTRHKAPHTSLAVLVVETAPRAVRAWIGSPDYFSAARDGAIDMTRAIRSPGSTLKPFLYGLAFEQGFLHPRTVIPDVLTRFGAYMPHNFSRHFSGDVSAAEALRRSLNIPAVAVLDRLGPLRFVQRFEALGLTLHFADPTRPPGLPIALGGVGLSLQDLVALYAALADGGRYRPLHWRQESSAPRRTPPASRPPERAAPGTASPSSSSLPRLMEPAAAWQVADILRTTLRPASHPTPRAAKADRIAYKTGTSYGFRDAWAIGFDRRHTVGVWVGRPDGTARPGFYGHNTAAPLLFEIFGVLEADPAPLPPLVPRPEGVADPQDRAPLPRRLRRLTPRGSLTPLPGSLRHPPLAVLFPPDGARIALERQPSPRPNAGTGDGSGTEIGGDALPLPPAYRPLPLKAHGGTPPLRWVVNGRPLPPRRSGGRDRGYRAFWTPDGAGAVHILVIDAKGQRQSVEVWLE